MNEHDYLALSADEAHQIRRQEPSARSVRALSDLFSVFADTTRIRIMYALYADELCVGDIASILGLSQSAISHQLRILKDARLVASRRKGRPCSTHLTMTMSAPSWQPAWNMSKRNK